MLTNPDIILIFQVGGREETRTPAYFHICNGLHCMAFPNSKAYWEIVVTLVHILR